MGSFDIVFYLGVLYHMQEPLTALKRLAMVTQHLAIIETQAIYLQQHENLGIMEFYESNELNNDPSNWFAPNLLGVTKMLRAAGFRDIKVTSPYPPVLPADVPKGTPIRYRLVVQALK